METFDVVVNKCKSYNQTVEFIVQANEISSRTGGQPLALAEEEKLHQGTQKKEGGVMEYFSITNI